jgi:hypothetical protein
VKLTTDLYLEPRSIMVELYIHSPYVSMAQDLIKHRENLENRKWRNALWLQPFTGCNAKA